MLIFNFNKKLKASKCYKPVSTRFEEQLVVVFPSASDRFEAVDDAGGGKNVDDDEADRAVVMLDDATPRRSVDDNCDKNEQRRGN